MPKADEYYVWKMSLRNRREPLSQVNQAPLSLERAKRLAQRGAEKGKNDRAVTPSPKSNRFTIVAQYAAGTGKDVTIMYRRAPPGTPRRKKSVPSVADVRSPGDPAEELDPVQPASLFETPGT